MSGHMTLSGEIVLTVFLALLLSIVAYELKKLLSLPVAPVLFILGICLRIIGSYMGGLVGVSVGLLDELDPLLVLLAIMPALIFEASLGTDWYTFKSELAQIVPMATTVVVVSTALTAIVLKQLFGYSFTWPQALLLGVILSATDHVAVVAQLKEVIASKRLETLIAGETLLNEATVLVIFSVMVTSATGEADISQSIGLFFRLSLGGFVLGMLFALVLGYFLNRMINDDLQEITITIVTAYLLFFVADATPVRVSGALATVTLGLYMSAYGKTLVSPMVEHTLHMFWKILGTNIESVVFIMGGMLLGMHFLEPKSIVMTDIWYLFAMFALSYVIRAISVFLHYPLICRVGYGLTIKEALLVIISGTKGAIATALGLMVYNNPDLDEHFRELALFYAVGISALTIVLGSFGVKLTVALLGLEGMTEIQEKMLIGVTSAIVEETEHYQEAMKRESEYKMVNWEKVDKVAGANYLIKEILRTTNRGKKIMNDFPDRSGKYLMAEYNRSLKLDQEKLVYETRRKFFATLKGIYWHFFLKGQCFGESVLILMNSACRAMDEESSPMDDWRLVQSAIGNTALIKVYLKCSNIPLLGGVFRKLLYDRMSVAYDCSRTFIRAHKEAEELIDEMEIDIDRSVFERTMKEANEQISKCDTFLSEQIVNAYPTIVSEVQSRMASYTLLLRQRSLISEIYEQGVIEELEHEKLIGAIDQNLKLITFNAKPRLPTVIEILKNRFPGVPAEKLREAAGHIDVEHFEKDKELFKQGEENTGGYLIMSGRVHENSDWVDQELRIGNIVGVQNLLPHYKGHENTSTACAVDHVMAAHISKDTFSDEDFNKGLYLEASEELLLLNKKDFKLEGVKNEHLYKITRNSFILVLKDGEHCGLANGGFLLHGEFGSKKAYAYLRPKDKERKTGHNCIILSFSMEIHDAIQQTEDLAKAFAHFALRQGYKLVAGQKRGQQLLNLGVKTLDLKDSTS